MAELEPRLVPLTTASGQAPASISAPAFSPDGRSLAFHAPEDKTIRRVAVEGGAAVTVCAAQAPNAITWDDSGVLIAQGTSVVRCSPNGGPPEPLVGLQDGEFVLRPQRLPGSGALLLTVSSPQVVGRARWDAASIVVQSAAGDRKTLVQPGTDGRYLDSGHLAYVLSSCSPAPWSPWAWPRR
ncbi:MAG: hypothetical protein ACT4QD_00475 [Acidobacteriota bacterium]